jgi:hypothetical protein
VVPGLAEAFGVLVQAWFTAWAKAQLVWTPAVTPSPQSWSPATVEAVEGVGADVAVLDVAEALLGAVVAEAVVAEAVGTDVEVLEAVEPHPPKMGTSRTTPIAAVNRPRSRTPHHRPIERGL